MLGEIGIRITDKTDDEYDINEVIDDINMVIEKHGLRVRQFAEWKRFRDSCIKEKKFMDNLFIGELK